MTRDARRKGREEGGGTGNWDKRGTGEDDEEDEEEVRER